MMQKATLTRTDRCPRDPGDFRDPGDPRDAKTKTKNARVNPHPNKNPMQSFKIKNQPSESTSESTRPIMPSRKPYRYNIPKRPEGCRQKNVLLAAAARDVKWQRTSEFMQHKNMTHYKGCRIKKGARAPKLGR